MPVQLDFPDPPLAAAPVILRRLTSEDLTWITAACSDREMSRYSPAIPHPYTQAHAHAFAAQTAQGWADGTSATFVIARPSNGEGAGIIELDLGPADPGRAGVGYWLRPEERGCGAATTALRLVAGWAFETLGIERLDLTTDPENQPSQRVAERAGFTREGLLRSWLPTPDGRRDRLIYSLLADEPSAVPMRARP